MRPGLRAALAPIPLAVLASAVHADVLEWRRADAIVAPAPRSHHEMVYDDARGTTLLFGGYDATFDFFADTWSWDGEQWTLLATDGPEGRYDAATAYDGARGVVVLFGGYGGPRRPGEVYSDTWEWDGDAWTLVADTGPTPRFDAEMAFDAARGVTVLFGGSGSAREGPLFDTWEWDGQSWTAVADTGPRGRHDHALAYDPVRERTVLFGGDGSQRRGDTWEWDGETWTLMSESGPSPRDEHALVYHAGRGTVVLFGGYLRGSLSDTWEWDGAAWRELELPGPPAREDHALAYDVEREAVVLFGGWDNAERLSDTWEMVTLRAPVGTPDLTLERPTDDTARLSWSGLGDASGYDVVQGDLRSLHAGDGLGATVLDCAADDRPETSLDVGLKPGPNEALWFLVRGTGAGGDGTYDTEGTGQIGLRDAAVDGSPEACP